MVNHAVILATSATTYRGNLATDRSPVMLPALGKPIVVRAMDSLYRNGINNYTVVIGLKESTITSYLDENWVPNAEITYRFKPDTEKLSQTLSNIATDLQTPFLFITYNSFTHHHYLETLISKHTETPAKLILTGAQSALSRPQICWEATFADGELDDIQQQTSPTQGTTPLTMIAACGTNFIEFLTTESAIKKTSSFFELVKQYRTWSQESVLVNTASWFLQVENDEHLLLLNNRLMQDGTDAHILSELPQSVRVIPPVRIDPQVAVGERTTIGPYVYLERGCSIGSDVTIQNSLVLDSQSIRAGSTIDKMIIHQGGTITI